MPNRLPNRFINASLRYDGLTDDTTIGGTWGGASWASMTWMAWVRIYKLSTTDVLAALVSSTGANFMHLQLNQSTGSNVAIYINSGVILMAAPFQQQFVNGWHHIAVSTKSGSTNVYFDGVLFSTNTTSYTNITQATALRFGEGFGSSRNTYCNMTDVAVFKAADGTGALTQAQIQQAMANGPSTTISSTLYGYWPHTDGVGTTLTDTITGNNGTITGATWSFSTPVTKRPIAKSRGSGSVFFNGTTQYGKTGTITFGINQITVAAWVKPQGTPSAVILESSADYNSNNAFIIANGGINAERDRFSGGAHGTSGGAFATKNSSPFEYVQDWHRVVLTWDGSLTSNESNIYVDGKLAEASVGNNNTTNNLADAVLNFASRNGASAFFRGFMGATIIQSSKIWSAAEVLADYLYDQQPSATVLAKYDFTNGSGTTVTDSSGNGYHITLTGTPTWSTDVPCKSRTAVS